MAYVDARFALPGIWEFGGAVPSFTTATLNAAGEKAAWIFQAPKTGNIRKLHWRTGTVTTPQDVDVRLETVDATNGNPSGSLQGTNTNATQASAGLAANTWFATQLTADAAVTMGDYLAMVLAPASSPNFQVWQTLDIGQGSNQRFPYSVDSETGSYVKNTTGPWPIAAEYDDGSFGVIQNTFPVSAINTHTFNSGSTPDELAMAFTLPFGCKVRGAWIVLDLDNDADLVLYGPSTVTLAIDKDIRAAATGSLHIYQFTALQTLAASTVYRLAFKPNGSNSSAYSVDFNSAALMDQLAGGQNVYYSSRTDGGAWSDTTTRRLMAGIIIDSIDTGSAGGLLRHPGMSGGLI